MDTIEINKRYSKLAEDTCCLSCGGAIDLSQPKEGEVCVDLGCGRGTDVIRLAQTVGEKGFAYGIDISDGMLEKARKNAEKLEVKNAEFIKSELEKLELQSNTADLVISNCTINHAMDKSSVWNEIYRVLKKGGRFVISDIYSIGVVPEEYRTDPEAVAECWAGAVPKEDYLTVVSQAGFTGIEILEESKPYPKGKIEVVSFTIAGKKPSSCCCC
ncbi:MAG TPA: methyltransferase domain-containing protein [Ignavibacteriales bacterium]|nr:methyltransferase domain-containing protein [Ignavibacteriales bacterium]